MRKPTFRIRENKDAVQLRGYRAADQRLCFLYIDSTIPLLYKSEISSLQLSPVAEKPGLCLGLVGIPDDRFSHYANQDKKSYSYHPLIQDDSNSAGSPGARQADEMFTANITGEQ